MSCLKCRNHIADESVSCDSCERQIDIKCSNLNPQELKVMTLRGGKRTLKYYCEECLEGIRIIPKLLQRMDAFEEKLDKLRSNSFDVTNNPKSVEHTITEELMERQKRSCNIVIFNLKETNGESDADIAVAKQILEDLINSEILIQSALRVGKKNKNGNRALKVSLDNSVTAATIIQAKKDKLKGKHIYISADLTQSQRFNLQELKKELDTRKNSGETNLIIKYINGVPKIVNRPLN